MLGAAGQSGEVTAGSIGHDGVREANGEVARYAVVVARRLEAQLGVCREQHGGQIGDTGADAGPIYSVVGRIIPGPLRGSRGITDDSDSTECAGRIAAAGDGALVVSGIAVTPTKERINRGPRICQYIFENRTQRLSAANGDGRCVVHVGHGGSQGQRILCPRPGRRHCAKIFQIRRVGTGYQRLTVVRHAHGQRTRGALEVGRRHKMQLGIG